MTYSLKIKRSAEKEMDKLADAVHKRISQHILELEINPRPVGIKKLHGVDGYRLRIEDYRLIYTIDDKNTSIEIISVGHRKEIYR